MTPTGLVAAMTPAESSTAGSVDAGMYAAGSPTPDSPAEAPEKPVR